MNKSILIVLILCLAICLCLVPVFLIHKNAESAQAEAESAEEAPSPEPEPSDAEDDLVLVVFESDKTEDFSGLTVQDKDGVVRTPVTNSESGESVFGAYRLEPGEYRFSFHDERGELEDLNDVAFTVWENISKALVSLSENPRVIGQVAGLHSFINPIYSDIVSEDDLPQLSEEDRAKALDEFKKVLDALDGK